jgi:hypothetical protein
MRTHRIFGVLAGPAAGLVLVPLALWATHGSPGRVASDRNEVVSSGAMPPTAVSGMSSVAEVLRELAARREAAAAALVGPPPPESPRLGRRPRASRSWTLPRGAPAPPTTPGDVWARLRRCEAGGDYDRNSGNGYYGAYQFSASTWHSLGYRGRPDEAPPAVQDEAARRLQRRSGWGQWPACSRRAGAR